jgi:hypothetical protein
MGAAGGQGCGTARPASRAHIEKGRTVTGHRRHQEVAIQEQISHLAARPHDQQAAVASGAVRCSIAAAVVRLMVSAYRVIRADQRSA